MNYEFKDRDGDIIANNAAGAKTFRCNKLGKVADILTLHEVLNNALQRPLTREEALFLFKNTETEEDRNSLYAAARAVRKAETGDVFHFTGGIASVLPCRLRPLCSYCPYWRKKDQNPLPLEAIVAGARYFQREGVKEFHLSGGTTLGSEGKEVLEIVRKIHEAGLQDMKIMVNCGAAMSVDSLKQLKAWGVDSIGAVFEITNPEVFRKVKPGDDLDKKLQFAWDIQKAGLALSSGIMAGLGPKETRYEDYVNSLFDIAQFPHLSSVYISKFTPDPVIPMHDWEACSVEEAARLVAIARLVYRSIKITTAAGWTEKERTQGILAGAGNALFSLAVNLKVDYWQGRQQEATFSEENIEYRDTRAAKRAMAEQCGITISEE
ncbi:radical SAM protein [Desulfosporosinus sp. PR]|uniref:biotin synthase BioB n=1 Tax=Candidatus Desulfosporosinus nitrosoreducens TaxID=3401928 RepID=UPI0027F1617D|nr:radical SAM protein [Desulfosporosinus sp. PR]MDQ7094556.1 radical SAM protein [Desulfosporosinus sp. PR]